MPNPVEIAVDTYIRACCSVDGAARAKMFEACLAEDVRMVTGSREVRGRTALVQMLDGFLGDSKLAGIRLLSQIDARGTAFRYRAVADFRDGTSAESFDAGEIDESGRISLILTFAGPLAEAGLGRDNLAAQCDPDTSALQAVLSGPPDAEIVAQEAALRSAQLAADLAELDRLISEDLLFTGPDGSLASKQQDLAAHRSGAVRFREHEPIELRIRRVGRDVAVVALLARLVVEVGGKSVGGRYRYTRVWARVGSTWRVVGGHVAVVETP